MLNEKSPPTQTPAGLGKDSLKGSLRVAGAAYDCFYDMNCTDPTFKEKLLRMRNDLTPLSLMAPKQLAAVRA